MGKYISYTRYERAVAKFEDRDNLEHHAMMKAKREAEALREKTLRQRMMNARILEAA
jgi:hypothetical protein